MGLGLHRHGECECVPCAAQVRSLLQALGWSREFLRVAVDVEQAQRVVAPECAGAGGVGAGRSGNSTRRDPVAAASQVRVGGRPGRPV